MMKWYSIYPEVGFSDILIDRDDYLKRACNKCYRLLDDNISLDFKIGKKINVDFFCLSSLGLTLVSDKMRSIISQFDSIVNFIEVDKYFLITTSEIANLKLEKVRYGLECQVCGKPTSITTPGGLKNSKANYFDFYKGQGSICRTNEKTGHSAHLIYNYFINETLFSEFKKEKLKGIIYFECV